MEQVEEIPLEPMEVITPEMAAAVLGGLANTSGASNQPDEVAMQFFKSDNVLVGPGMSQLS